MGIEASVSKLRRNNLKLYAAVCLIFAVIFAYDGYLSKYQWSHRYSFYEQHVKEGNPDDTMKFNRVASIILIALAVVFAIRFRSLKDKKMLADDSELFISDKERIPYDSIEKIDKTHFSSKGYFILTYKDSGGNEISRKMSDRDYDNLAAILEHLVTKIKG